MNDALILAPLRWMGSLLHVLLTPCLMMARRELNYVYIVQQRQYYDIIFYDVRDYRKQYDVKIQLRHGGNNTIQC